MKIYDSGVYREMTAKETAETERADRIAEKDAKHQPPTLEELTAAVLELAEIIGGGDNG